MEKHNRFSLGFSDGHPQRYHVAAILLAVVALSIAISITVFAGDRVDSVSGSTNTSSAPETTVVRTGESVECEYDYSDWGACQSSGKRNRSVKGISPSNCNRTSQPRLEESCRYTEPISAKTGTQNIVTVTGTAAGVGRKSESDSVKAVAITPERATITQCEYAYFDWGACRSNGKRTRDFKSKSPNGCVEYTRPVLEQSCVYDSAFVSNEAASSASKRTGGGSTSSDMDAQIEAKSAGSDLKSSSVTAVRATSVPVSGGTEKDTVHSSYVTPEFRFANIENGASLHDVFEIRGAVSGAKSVEYYLIPSGSNADKYIGTASRISDTDWSLSFRSQDLPNGDFYLRAKIKNAYGEYVSGGRRISIMNEGDASVTTVAKDGSVSVAMQESKKRSILQEVVADLQIPDEVMMTTPIASESATVDGSSDASAVEYDQKKKQIFDYCQSKPQSCHLERDTDKDGLSDIDELRYGTDPKTADTDLDGFIDGDEVGGGFDPLKYSPGDKSDRVVFEDPKISGEVKKDVYAVKDVELKDGDTGEKKLHLSGKGLPNSFVTIYVHSDPIVLTVKTDSDGNWSYDLDKNLEDGTHEVYVAVTDNTGKITAKSEPVIFVKTAQAATVIPSAQAAPLPESHSVIAYRTQKDMLYVLTIVIAALAVGLAMVGLAKHRSSVK